MNLSESDSDPTKLGMMKLARIIYRSISQGIIRGSEKVREKVRMLPMPWNTLNPLFCILKFKWASTVGAIVEHFGRLSARALLDSRNLDGSRDVMMLAPLPYAISTV